MKKIVMDRETLSGSVDAVIFRNEDTCYTVTSVSCGEAKPVNVVGTFASISPGEMLIMDGEWTSHPKYGRQFSVDRYSVFPPATIRGIESYLGSGCIRGIGPETAARIVAKFGTYALEAIEKEPESLLKVHGIGKTKIETIKESWKEQRSLKDLLVFLQSYGIGVGLGVRLHRKYGAETLNILMTNPFRAVEVWGVGFKTVDEMAGKLGHMKESPMRIDAGISYTLQQITEEGHVCSPLEDLVEKAVEILEVERSLIMQSIQRVAYERAIRVENDGLGDSIVYLTELYNAEKTVAEKLARLSDMTVASPRINLTKGIPWVENKMGISLTQRQAEAVSCAFLEKAVVITGKPGTGKTTVVGAIVELYRQIPGAKVLLCAPTGRAAKRLSEVTGQDAVTIHRLLEYNGYSGRFTRDEKNPIECDALILDEISMADIQIMASLLRAFPPKATFIAVGDHLQLPSVGAGSVLKSVIDSKTLNVVQLDEVKRQGARSKIIEACDRISRGESIDWAGGQDFLFIEEDDPNKALEIVIALATKDLPAKYGADPFLDIQVIAPMKKGSCGVDRLNKEMQQSLNRRGRPVTDTLRIGDRVMQTRNNYSKECFNGDLGIIKGVIPDEGIVTVDFDGRPVRYEMKELGELQLAYSQTVHKSQGNEYPIVIMPILNQFYPMLARNLIYTGISRAKQLMVLVGSKQAISIAVRNDKIQKRHTRLDERLKLANRN